MCIYIYIIRYKFNYLINYVFPLFISFLGRERHFVIGEIVPILSCETKIGCQEPIALQSSRSVSNHLNKITQGCFLMKSCFRPRIFSVEIFYNGLSLWKLLKGIPQHSDPFRLTKVRRISRRLFRGHIDKAVVAEGDSKILAGLLPSWSEFRSDLLFQVPYPSKATKVTKATLWNPWAPGAIPLSDARPPSHSSMICPKS